MLEMLDRETLGIISLTLQMTLLSTAISAAVGIPYNDVLSDLQNLVTDGYLPGAYIDISQRKIILGDMTQQFGAQFVAPTSSIQVQTTAVKCPGCSANNKVTVGQTAVCEYCKTFLQ